MMNKPVLAVFVKETPSLYLQHVEPTTKEYKVNSLNESTEAKKNHNSLPS